MGLVCSGPWGQICCRALGLTLRICLVWVILGKMEKIQEENMRENGWEEYLVRKGGWRENWTPEPTKNKSSQIGEKAKKKICIFCSNFKKSFCPLVHSHSKSNAWLFNIILFFLLFFLTTTNLPELILIK